jgi:hypothetical protein
LQRHYTLGSTKSYKIQQETLQFSFSRDNINTRTNESNNNGLGRGRGTVKGFVTGLICFGWYNDIAAFKLVEMKPL